MKNIKELGLELIELEDQVLLVDDKKLIINGYIHRGTEKPVINKPDFWFDFGVRYKNVIASTKPLEGLPLLVIEDEAMSNALNLIEESKIETESTKLILIGAYTTGYNKAKETFKFTEEDLRKAIDMARLIYEKGATDDTFTAEDISGFTEICTYGWKNKHSNDEIIQSLTKKELWIEVVFNSKYGQRGSWTYGDYELANKNLSEFMVVKITDGKIKAIWK